MEATAAPGVSWRDHRQPVRSLAAYVGAVALQHVEPVQPRGTPRSAAEIEAIAMLAVVNRETFGEVALVFDH